LADEAAEEWGRLAVALSTRACGPSLIVDCAPQRETAGQPPGCSEADSPLPALRIARAVLDDRLAWALAEPVTDAESHAWRAVALRRAGRTREARQAFRVVGTRPEHVLLYERALGVLGSGGGGFRWAAEAAALLTARGGWDPVWFVDACAAAQTGLLSRESAALLEEIQRAELQLMLDARAAG
jgi:hypothetical protein